MIWAVIFGWSLMSTGDSPDLHYAITLLPASPEGVPQGIRIDLRFDAGDSTQTTLRAQDPTGGAAGGADLQRIEVRWWPADGSDQSVVGDPLQVAPNRWTVEHAPQSRVSCSYSFPLNGNRVSEDPSDFNRPLVEADRVHLIGSLALLRPEQLDEWEPISVQLDWTGFEAAGWNTISSFGVGNVRFLATPVDLLGTICAAGRNLRLHERKIRGADLVVAVEGDRWPFSDQEFVELATTIVDEQRVFFNDDSPPWFLVSLTPIGVPSPDRSTRSGVGLTNAVGVFLQEGLGLTAEGRPGRGIDHLLAHEIFHHWNGLLIFREEPVELAAWFSEGFTDFYARRLLFRSGHIDLETYARILNATIEEHARSPARHLPNSVFEERLWEHEDTHRMVYLRGDLTASLIDSALRKSSKGERSLDDLMRALAEEARRDRRARVSTAGLIERIESLTSPAFGARLRAIILEGAPLELPLDLFEPCLTGAMGEVYTVDPGFDTVAIRDTGLVAGVREGSRAFKAGLRNGQRCTSFQFSDEPSEQGEPFVTVRILVDAEQHELRFSARGAEIPVPVFRPKQNAAAGCAEL